MDPHQKRERDARRLTGLKAGAVGLTVAGLGVFAGLAAAGSDSTPAAPSPMTAPAGSQTAQDAARAAGDGAFFDEQAMQGAVGEYQGYDGAYGAGAAQGAYAPPSQGSSGAS